MTIPFERPTMCIVDYRIALKTSWRVMLSFALSTLFAFDSAEAQKTGDVLNKSFDEFMKGLSGARPATTPNSGGSAADPNPVQPGRGSSGMRPDPATGGRDSTYVPPNSRPPYVQPGTSYSNPNSGRTGIGGSETRPEPFGGSLRPGYPFEGGNGGLDYRSMPAEVELGGNLPLSSIADDETFDWKQQTTSIADLRFATSTVFRHGDAWLEPEAQEETAYLDMLDAIAKQRERLLEQVTRDNLSASEMRAKWEEAFYMFTHARRMAWDNGNLRNGTANEILSGMSDPFRAADEPTKPMASATDQQYSLSADISNFPEDFVGRPVVLIGMFTRNSVVRIPNELRPLPPVSGQIPKEQVQLRVIRGTLTAIGSNRKLATVDTQNITFPEAFANTSVNLNEGPIPVLVKGWVVKNWDGKPLIYSEALRLLSPIPHNDLVRNSTIDKRRLQDEEKWIYYETLMQMELSSAVTQREIAGRVLSERIDSLMKDVRRKAGKSLGVLRAKEKSGKISPEDFTQQKVSLQRQMSQRVDRYLQLRKHPEDFQTYVDLFQNPEVWHGKLLTLRGHVRHVVSYPADEILFGENQMLHELWLFTDDSQHNPAVIVTPSLPIDFPTDASVIDSVSVTGCFFKRYVYGSQDSARIAPLLIAGRIDWLPTVDQIQQLVKDGDLAAKSVRAQKAAALTSDEIGETAMTLVCVFVVLVLMILWGRAQREERDRIRLRKRVDEVPVFESPLLPGYSAAHSEFVSDTHDGLNLP